MVKYDAEVIVTFAESLYRQASSIVRTYTVVAVLAGLFVGGVVGHVVTDTGGWLAGAVVGALLFGFAGFRLGQQRAFVLRLQAQVALCQVQIEANTRGAASRV
jgi:hypothetical protein